MNHHGRLEGFLGYITVRVAATLLVVALAALAGWFVWQYYVYSPWTRDARVEANVINIAPEVSGTVTQVAVADNSYVRKGQLLFKVQPVRFKHALAEARAALAEARAQSAYATRNAERLEKLPAASVSTRELQQAQSKAHAAVAAVAKAKAQRAQAQQNLDWASVSSPVDGYVTHLLLNKGDYAHQGSAAMTLVDARTFHITGYFEETKLAGIAVGDPVDITLMAGDTHLKGRVTSIGRGIAVANNASGERNLPKVSPTFQWVRLAQRVPVNIAFDQQPKNITLSVGLSATVRVHPNEKTAPGPSAHARTPG